MKTENTILSKGVFEILSYVNNSQIENSDKFSANICKNVKLSNVGCFLIIQKLIDIKILKYKDNNKKHREEILELTELGKTVFDKLRLINSNIFDVFNE